MKKIMIFQIFSLPNKVVIISDLSLITESCWIVVLLSLLPALAIFIKSIKTYFLLI